MRSYKKLFFPSLKGYKTKWIHSDFIAALIVTAIAIPESLGFAVIVGLPVQTGLYCALLAPIVFAVLTSSKRLVVGADSATAALVASGGATIALAGTPEYANAIAVLGLLTGAVLLIMAIVRFGFLADLISQTVLVGFISGVGIQLLIGKLPEMLGLHAHGNLFTKISFVTTHLRQIEVAPFLLSTVVVTLIVLGWKYRLPGALFALLLSIVATKFFNLPTFGIEVVGIVPQGLPAFHFPQVTTEMLIKLLPAALSIALVILAQSLAVIRSAAARHDEKVKENQDLLALGVANLTSAVIGGFAINGSPPRTSAGEMAGGKSQLVNVFMAIFVGVILVVATGLFAFVPIACLAAVVFSIGLHLIKIKELREIFASRKSEFAIALLTLICVALLGVQQGIMIAVLLSLIERLRRQYHPHDEVLLRDELYTDWAAMRLCSGKYHKLETPAGLLVYRFNEAIFFENASYFLKRVTRALRKTKNPVKSFILDASAITDIDYTGAKVLKRFYRQLRANDIQFGLAHVSPHLRSLLKRYKLTDKIDIFPSLRFAIDAYTKQHITSRDRIHSLNLSPKDYIVIGGGALELLGIRETNEIDLVVNKRTYNRLNKHPWKEYIQDDGKRILSRKGYKIMLNWVGRNLKDLQKTAFLVDDIPVMSINDLIACKTQLGRKKDLQDIIRIKKYKKEEMKEQHEESILIRVRPAVVTA